LIAHISDLHAKDDGVNQARFMPLRNAISSESKAVAKVILCISGDISQSGISQEFNAIKDSIQDIRATVENQGKHFDCIVTPGNHDKNFQTSGKNEAYSDYNKFRNCVSDQDKILHLSDEYCFHLHRMGAVSLCFISINTSYSMKDKTDVEVTFPDISGFSSKLSHNSIVISMFHHPELWLEKRSENQKTQLELEKYSNFIFVGHKHKFEGYGLQYYQGSPHKTDVLTAQAFNDKISQKYGFHTIIVDVEEMTYSIKKYELENDECSADDIVISRLTPFYKHYLSSGFVEELDKPSINIMHRRKKDVKCSELFVAPSLKKMCKNSYVMVDYDEITKKSANNCVIYGGNQAGKTSLLRKYFLMLFYQASYPIMLSGKQVKTSNTIGTKIKAAINDQYVKFNWSAFLTVVNKEDRVIIIDDFDRIEFDDFNQKKECIDSLLNDFGRVIISVNVLVYSDYLLDDFTQYHIQQLSNVSTLELIKKWVYLGRDSEDVKSREVGNIVEDLNTKMEAMFVNRIVDRHPFFVISSLMILDNLVPHDQLTQYSDYFHYMISIALEKAMDEKTQIERTPTRIAQYIDFLKPLSFAMFSRNQHHLTINEFNGFVNERRKEYVLPESDHMLMLDVFVKSGVLMVHESKIRFTLDYNYHLSLGKYLAENAGDQEVENIIDDLIKNIHLVDYSSILLFLSHHATTPFDRTLWLKLNHALSTYLENIEQETLTPGRLSQLTDIDTLLPMELEEMCRKPIEQQQKEKDERMALIERITSSSDDSTSIDDYDEGLLRVIHLTQVVSHTIRHRYSRTRRVDLQRLIIETVNANLRLLHQFVEVSDDVTNPIRHHLLILLKHNISKNLDCYPIMEKANEIVSVIFFFCVKVLSIYPPIMLCSGDLLEPFLTAIPDSSPVYQLMKVAVILRYSKEVKSDEVDYIKKTIESNNTNYWVIRLIKEEYAHYIQNRGYKKIPMIEQAFTKESGRSKKSQVEDMRKRGLIVKRQ